MIEFFDQEFLKYEYLRPLKDCFKMKHLKKENIIKKNKKKILRKLFYTKELFLNEIEINFLNKVENLINPNSNLKKPKFWKIGDSLNLLYISDFDEEKFINIIKFHWNFINNWDKYDFTNSQIILSKGLIYQLGRDNKFFPNIFIDFEKYIPENNNESYFLALNFLIKFVKTYMLLPDYLEKLNIIINLNNLNKFSFNYGILQILLEYIDNFFYNIINKFYILNWGILFKVTISGFNKLLENRIKNKLKIITNINELFQKNFNKNQIELKFGGKLEDLKEFWPPSDTYINFKKIEIYDIIKRNDDIFYFDNYHFLNINLKKNNKTLQLNNLSKNFSNIFNSFQYNNNDLQQNRKTFKTNLKEDNEILKNENKNSILSHSEENDDLNSFINPFYKKEESNNSENEIIDKLSEKNIIINKEIDIKNNNENYEKNKIKNLNKKCVKIFNDNKKVKKIILFNNNKNSKKLYNDTLEKNEKLIQSLEKKYNVNQNNNFISYFNNFL